jgi:hypothetical protein
VVIERPALEQAVFICADVADDDLHRLHAGSLPVEARLRHFVPRLPVRHSIPKISERVVDAIPKTAD